MAVSPPGPSSGLFDGGLHLAVPDRVYERGVVALLPMDPLRIAGAGSVSSSR